MKFIFSIGLYIEDKDYKRVSNGAYIDNIFNSDKLLVKYKDKNIGLYILDNDKNIMKPYIMF